MSCLFVPGSYINPPNQSLHPSLLGYILFHFPIISNQVTMYLSNHILLSLSVLLPVIVSADVPAPPGALPLQPTTDFSMPTPAPAARRERRDAQLQYPPGALPLTATTLITLPSEHRRRDQAAKREPQSRPPIPAASPPPLPNGAIAVPFTPGDPVPNLAYGVPGFPAEPGPGTEIGTTE